VYDAAGRTVSWCEFRSSVGRAGSNPVGPCPDIVRKPFGRRSALGEECVEQVCRACLVARAGGRRDELVLRVLRPL